MKAHINVYALNNTNIDSASLRVLGSLAHPLTDPGEYVADVVQGEINVGTFRLKVDPDCTSMQADVDLSKYDTKPKVLPPSVERRYSVAPKGYLLLFVSEGKGGFHVILNEIAAGKSAREKVARRYDTRSLEPGDVFIAQLLRPGIYEMTNSLGKAKGRISIPYPKPLAKPLFQKEPEKISLRDDKFSPDHVELENLQAAVFMNGMDHAAIQVALQEADYGKEKVKPEGTAFRWMNPSGKPAK